MKIHLIHGIHTGAGDTEVRDLIPYLAARGYEVVSPEYGFIFGLETRRINRVIIGTLLPYIEPGDICVGHSNGCCIAYELMLAGAPMRGAVFINAALNRSITRLPHVKWIDVYYNAGDQITEVAGIVQKLIGSPVDQYWGEMGHAGYDGQDPGIVNIDCGNTPPLPVVSGHSDIFSKLRAAWGPFIAERIRNHG